MDKTIIIKTGALFSISSRAGGNNDLTLDDSIHVKLYKNALINIGNNTYHYGPINHIIPIPNPVNHINLVNPIINDNFIILEGGSKYHVNSINIDPIGLTSILEIPQKVNFNPHTPIILPSNTILHTVDNLLEFTLTKAVHCVLL